MSSSTRGPLRGRRGHPGFEVADAPEWRRYVASWPAWRVVGACKGECPRAWVCGRARVCLEAHVRERVLVAALARLSAAVGERAPAGAEGKENPEGEMWV